MKKKCEIHGWHDGDECQSCVALAATRKRLEQSTMTASQKAGFDIDDLFALIDAGRHEEAADWEKRWREAVPELEPLAPHWQAVFDAVVGPSDPLPSPTQQEQQ